MYLLGQTPYVIISRPVLRSSPFPVSLNRLYMCFSDHGERRYNSAIFSTLASNSLNWLFVTPDF